MPGPPGLSEQLSDPRRSKSNTEKGGGGGEGRRVGVTGGDSRSMKVGSSLVVGDNVKRMLHVDGGELSGVGRPYPWDRLRGNCPEGGARDMPN